MPQFTPSEIFGLFALLFVLSYVWSVIVRIQAWLAAVGAAAKLILITVLLLLLFRVIHGAPVAVTPILAVSLCPPCSCWTGLDCSNREMSWAEPYLRRDVKLSGTVNFQGAQGLQLSWLGCPGFQKVSTLWMKGTGISCGVLKKWQQHCRLTMLWVDCDWMTTRTMSTTAISIVSPGLVSPEMEKQHPAGWYLSGAQIALAVLAPFLAGICTKVLWQLYQEHRHRRAMLQQAQSRDAFWVRLHWELDQQRHPPRPRQGDPPDEGDVSS